MVLASAQLYFLHGCDLNPHCKGCFNDSIWSPYTGKPFTGKTIDKIIEVSKPYWCWGLSILGGEPSASWNIQSAIKLARAFKAAYPGKDVWCWSGRTLEEIEKLKYGPDLLLSIDCLVDGRFIEELKDISLKWRGSSNQRVLKKCGIGCFREMEE